MSDQIIITPPVPTVSLVHPDEGRIIVNVSDASDYINNKGYRPIEPGEENLPTPAEKQAAGG